MISVVPEVPPVSVHQCQLPVLNSATCQCHISVPTSAHQCHISAHLSYLSVSPINANHATYQCRLSVCIS
ncbi:unnamed protein product, partial [Staurois parvus]